MSKVDFSVDVKTKFFGDTYKVVGNVDLQNIYYNISINEAKTRFEELFAAGILLKGESFVKDKAVQKDFFDQHRGFFNTGEIEITKASVKKGIMGKEVSLVENEKTTDK